MSLLEERKRKISEQESNTNGGSGYGDEDEKGESSRSGSEEIEWETPVESHPQPHPHPHPPPPAAVALAVAPAALAPGQVPGIITFRSQVQQPSSSPDLKRRKRSRKSTEDGRSVPVKWTTEMTGVLMQQIIRNIREGRRSENGFRLDVWKEVAAQVQLIGGGPPDLSGDKCQTKLENMKKKYNLWTRLRNLDEWGCDPKTGALVASEDVWNAEIARCPPVKEFRSGLPFCWEMVEIFEGAPPPNKNNNTGQGHHAFVPPPPPQPQPTPLPLPPPRPPNIRAEAPIGSNPLRPPPPKIREAAGSIVGSGPVVTVGASPVRPIPPLPAAPAPAAGPLIAPKGSFQAKLAAAGGMSRIQRAIIKFRTKYKNTSGWTTTDIFDGYDLLTEEGGVKADVFLCLDDDDEEEGLWLKRQLDMFRLRKNRTVNVSVAV